MDDPIVCYSAFNKWGRIVSQGCCQRSMLSAHHIGDAIGSIETPEIINPYFYWVNLSSGVPIINARASGPFVRTGLSISGLTAPCQIVINNVIYNYLTLVDRTIVFDFVNAGDYVVVIDCVEYLPFEFTVTMA